MAQEQLRVVIISLWPNTLVALLCDWENLKSQNLGLFGQKSTLRGDPDLWSKLDLKSDSSHTFWILVQVGPDSGWSGFLITLGGYYGGQPEKNYDHHLIQHSVFINHI